MRSCCEEYRDAIAEVQEVRRAHPNDEHTPHLDRLEEFLRERWDEHIDQAGEAAWND